MENISLRQIFKESWELFKTNYKVLIPAALILGVVSFVGQSEIALVVLVSFALSILFQMGFIKLSLDIVDGVKPEMNTLLSQKKKFLRYFFMVVLVSICVTVPITILSILFITLPIVSVPIVITALFALVIFVIFPRLMFANVLIIDTEETAWQSIKTSYEITRQHAVKLFTFLFFIIFINILGAIPIGLGLIVTIPISQLMIVKFYRKISAKLMPVVEEAPTEIIEVENTPA